MAVFTAVARCYQKACFLSRQGISALVAAGVATLPAFSVGADDFSGTNLLAGAVFLQTGGSASVLRTNLPWIAPANLSHPALVFSVGFASDEVFAPGEFFDSFTISVRNAEQTFIAPALTADLLGVNPAPANPDGAQFSEDDVQPEPLSFPPLGSSFRFQQALLVLVALPPAFAGQSGTVGVSLFDNQNHQHSVGFINHIAVVPGPGSLMVVESSASASGPYAAEGQVRVRHARRCISLPRPGAHRFYRLHGSSESRITLMRADGNDWLFNYTGAEGSVPELLSSAQAVGPYAVESGVIANTDTHALRVRREGAARFFRLRCEIPLTIRHSGMEAGQTVIAYE